MRKMLSIAKYRGIGLLELMLSLAIIAILLIMAVRYFQSTSNSNAINTAVDECNATKAAVKAYVGANSLKTYFPTSLYTLVSQGYLPSSFGSTETGSATANPWGSAISIAISGTNGMTCTMTGVPTALCSSDTSPLVLKALGTLSQGETATCASGTFTVTYLL